MLYYTMEIKIHHSSIKTIKPDDPHFMIYDNMMIAPRAGLEISAHCPAGYKKVIEDCVRYGWLKPIAHISEKELLFIGLTKS